MGATESVEFSEEDNQLLGDGQSLILRGTNSIRDGIEIREKLYKKKLDICVNRIVIVERGRRCAYKVALGGWSIALLFAGLYFIK